MSEEATGSRVGRRVAAGLALAGAAVAVGVATWAVLAERFERAGAASLVAGALLLAVDVLSRPEAMRVERTLDGFLDRAFDGCILAAIAWVERTSEPSVAAAALCALGISFIAAYIQVRGAALGYRIEEATASRVIRYLLVSLALLLSLGWVLWLLAGLMLLAALLRASQVAKEERA